MRFSLPEPANAPGEPVLAPLRGLRCAADQIPFARAMRRQCLERKISTDAGSCCEVSRNASQCLLNGGDLRSDNGAVKSSLTASPVSGLEPATCAGRFLNPCQ